MPMLPTGPLPPSITAAFFKDIYVSPPRVWRGAVSALATRLTTFPLRADIVDKRRLPCWSPATFSQRGSKNQDVIEIGGLVLDIDYRGSIEDAERACGAWAMILYTTWSHTPANHRFRVVLPLAKPVPRHLWSAAWRAALAELDLPVDHACSNPNRRYLLPARPAQDASTYAVSRLDRPALDLLALAATAPPTTPPPAARAASICVPWHQVERATRLRLASDPESRRRAAASAGAHFTGAGPNERADHLTCPLCGRPSVWFYIAPERASRARCNHRNSCSWSGSLVDLLGGAP